MAGLRNIPKIRVTAPEIMKLPVDVEKSIEQLNAEAAAFRAEFHRNMAEVAKRQREAEVRMDRAEARMDRADARMDRFEKQLQATRKLVEAGMKMVVKLSQAQAADRKDFDYKIKAFVERLLRRRPNGRG
jgi:hypothetical protein